MFVIQMKALQGKFLSHLHENETPNILYVGFWRGHWGVKSRRYITSVSVNSLTMPGRLSNKYKRSDIPLPMQFLKEVIAKVLDDTIKTHIHTYIYINIAGHFSSL